MADKNLHDIKVDELDSPRKTPLKNILTLLALLFIILVISVVITKLILNTEEGASIENNNSKLELVKDIADTNKTAEIKSDDKKDETTTEEIPVISTNTTETSAMRAPLGSIEPKKMRTYTDPKKNDAPKEIKKVPKKTNVVKKEHTVKKHISQPKKQYIDKVVAKKETIKRTTSSKNSKFLGGIQKKVSNSYYIKVGTYRDATTVINKIKKNNFNYALVKVENDRSLTRVLVGPFFSRNQANAQLAKVKANILSGAYITKAK